MFHYRMRNNETVSLNVPETVYEPREDSILLAAALERMMEDKNIKAVLESNKLRPSSKNKFMLKVLEIGCGSGLLSIIAAKNGCEVLAADIDSAAVECAKRNTELNEVKIKPIQSDLFQNIPIKKFDLIVFNPPYLPEEQTEESRAWAGGEKMEIITRFIKEAKQYLEKGGKILIVISSLSKPESILKEFSKNGFVAEIIAEQKIPWEKLFVICAKLNLIYLKKNYSSSISQ